MPWTDLMLAADRGDTAAVSVMLAAGADQTAPHRQLSPQRLAMRRGHVEVLRLLQRVDGDEQRLTRPMGAGPDAVVLRWHWARPSGLARGLAGSFERFAFDGRLLWFRAFKNWQGPVDLDRLRVVYIVPASGSARFFLLQDDMGFRIAARVSNGAAAITASDTPSSRSSASDADTSMMWPGFLAAIARRAFGSNAIAQGRTRALLEQAIIDDAAMRTDPG